MFRPANNWPNGTDRWACVPENPAPGRRSRSCQSASQPWILIVHLVRSMYSMLALLGTRHVALSFPSFIGLGANLGSGARRGKIDETSLALSRWARRAITTKGYSLLVTRTPVWRPGYTGEKRRRENEWRDWVPTLLLNVRVPVRHRLTDGSISRER